MSPLFKGAITGAFVGLLTTSVVLAGDIGGLATLTFSTQLAVVALPLMVIKLSMIFAMSGLVIGTMTSGESRAQSEYLPAFAPRILTG